MNELSSLTSNLERLDGCQEMKDNDFDRLVAELQRQIDAQARALYSEKVIQEVNDPKNVGRMPAANAHAAIRGWCGDTMEIYLRLNGERIKEATFFTDGCGPTVACGSKLTTTVTGMSLKDAGLISAQELIDALDGLPEDSLHCAELAVQTLQAAIASHNSA
jgi:nitrogen fixation NifU-like protein